jgi:hypothetical protein
MNKPMTYYLVEFNKGKYLGLELAHNSQVCIILEQNVIWAI